MKKSLTAALAAALVIGSLSLVGCSTWLESPAKPANDAIAVANTHLKSAATIEDEVSTKGSTLQSLPYTKEGAKQAGTIITAVKGSLASERTELEAAKKAMDGIAKLEVDAPFKQYAKLESAAIDARIALVDGQSRLYDAMDRLYSALAKTSKTTDMQETITAIQGMQEEVAALADSAAQAAQTAADFFSSNKLGG